MKKIKEKCIVLCIMMGVFTKINAQDIHFSQYRETPLLVNPAQAGMNRDFRVILNYKDQWRSIGSAYQTGAFSIEKALKKTNKGSYLGIGLQFFKDQSGDAKLTTTQGLFSLSGVVKVSRYSKLSTGLMAGIGQRSLNMNNLTWNEQYNGTNYDANLSSGEAITNEQSFTYPDLGTGFCWSYGKNDRLISSSNGIKASFGVSAWHLNQSKYSFNSLLNEKLYTKMIIHGNSEIGIKNTNILVVPEFLIVFQGKTKEINGGMMLKYILQESSSITSFPKGSSIGFGLNFRHRDALISSVLIEYGNYAIGLSYDANISPLRTVSNMRGGFEISLHFVTPNPFTTVGKVRF